MKRGVSFIILTWNSKKYITNCLNSILGISTLEKEVIVIDNGSTDGTREVIKKEFPTVRLIKLEKNYGTTYPRNLGLRMANIGNDYLCILDSDTVINERAISNLINCLSTQPEYMIAVPRMVNLKNVSQISYKRFPTALIKLLKAIPIKRFNERGERIEKYDFSLDQAVYEIDYGISACWMMKRQVLEVAGYLDERIFYAPEDVDYCATVWKNKGKVILATESKIIHDTQRVSKKNLFSKINFLHFIGLIYYFYKHRYIFSSRHIRENKEISEKRVL